MITEIRLKKGSGVPSSLKYAEPAVDMLNKVLYIGTTNNENGGSEFIKILDEKAVLSKIAENSGIGGVVQSGEGEGSAIIIPDNGNISQGNCSISGGYDSNALSDCSIALGNNNIAGSKGFYIKSIDMTNKKIYLTMTKVTPSVSTDDNTDTSFETPAYEVDDKLTILAKTELGESHLIDCTEIVSITNNVIIYSTELPFSQLNESSDDFPVLLCLKKPSVGIVDIGEGAYAEGGYNTAVGYYSHAEGLGSIAATRYAHAEGRASKAGYAAHAECMATQALGMYSHAEGGWTKALGKASHSEGLETIAVGSYAHAEGYKSEANGSISHSEGNETIADGQQSHAEGYKTHSISNYSHAEGNGSITRGSAAHAEGYQTEANGEYSHAEGSLTKATNHAAHAEGSRTGASGVCSHAEGEESVASGIYAHAEGRKTLASAQSAHAEGEETQATYIYTHAEGHKSKATGNASHAEGNETTSSAHASHAEGRKTSASGVGAHAEGVWSSATAEASHSEGYACKATARGAHAEGGYSTASYEFQHVEGKYNDINAPNFKNYVHVVGNGTSDKERSNAHTLDWNGNAWYAGDVIVGEDKKKLATEEYVNNAVANIEIPENPNGDSTDLTEVINMINNLHYYCNKDIAYNNDNFIIEEIDGMLGLGIFCENMTDGVLVIPYNIGNHEHFDVSYSQNVNKIIIPRGFNLYYNKQIATDEILVQVFSNLKTIVRIHEDGAVLSYNIEDQTMN